MTKRPVARDVNTWSKMVETSTFQFSIMQKHPKATSSHHDKIIVRQASSGVLYYTSKYFVRERDVERLLICLLLLIHYFSFQFLLTVTVSHNMI
jgi:hypothetical protein